MSEKNDAYPVGYGKPPAENRFRKGQSGNPGGKRRKPIPTNLDEALVEALAGRASVTGEEGEERVSQLQAIVDSLIRRARKGDKTCIKLVFERYERLSPVDRARLASRTEKAAARESEWQASTPETGDPGD